MDNTDYDSDIGDYVYSVENTDDDENISQFELVPRAVVTPSVSKRSDSWTEQESTVLLEAWEDKLLKNNGKHVGSEEWHEVAVKVSEVSICKRTKTNCRNRLDTLKKIYKKEKAKLDEGVGLSSNWVHFRKMQMILCPSSYRATEHGLVNSEAHFYRANSSNETRQIVDSNVHTDRTNSSDELKEIENSRVHPPRTQSSVEMNETNLKALSGKSEQFVELEKMRMDLIRDLELERRKIMKKEQVEMANIWEVVIEDNDLPPGNSSG